MQRPLEGPRRLSLAGGSLRPAGLHLRGGRSPGLLSTLSGLSDGLRGCINSRSSQALQIPVYTLQIGNQESAVGQKPMKLCRPGFPQACIEVEERLDNGSSKPQAVLDRAEKEIPVLDIIWLVEKEELQSHKAGGGEGGDSGPLEAEVLRHPVIAWVRDQPAFRPLPGLGPKIPLAPVAGIAGIEEVSVLALKLGKSGDGPVVVDPKGILSSEAIGEPAVDALP